MKKLVGLLLVLAQILLYGNIVFAKTGDVIGYAAHTDIVATINGAQIQSYNYNGYTYVVAEDLANYGFSTVWNASERKITVNRNYQVRSIYSNYKKPYVSKSQVGKKAYNVLESDITAVVNGYHLSTYNTLDWLGAYNINGKTIIPFDILEIFGTVQWDANARKISLWIPGIGNMGGGSKDASTVKNEFLARMKAIDAKTESLYGSAMTQQKMNSVSWLGYCMWDGMLNEVYQYLKIHRLSAQEFEMLKNDQIRWVNERDQQMKKVEREYQGGSICALMVNSTGMEYIENRCRYLISLF